MEKSKCCQTVCNVKEKCCNFLAKLGPCVPLLLRITLGIVFLQSGWGKLHNLDKVTQFFEELHIPLAHLQAPFVATVEFVSGIALLLGAFVRLASFLISATMVVALLTAKLSSFENIWDLFGSQEWDYLVMAIALMVMGAGCFSLCSLCKKYCCKKSESCCR